MNFVDGGPFWTTNYKFILLNLTRTLLIRVILDVLVLFWKTYFGKPQNLRNIGCSIDLQRLEFLSRGPEVQVLNYLRATIGGFKLSVSEKKFWKNNQKIGEIHLGKLTKMTTTSLKEIIYVVVKFTPDHNFWISLFWDFRLSRDTSRVTF